MHKFEALTFEKKDKLIVITLNRPKEANGLNELMAGELAVAAALCDNDPDVKAVILTGSGRFFCAGGDVKEMSAVGERAPAQIKILADSLHKAIATFSRMRAPLIVAINGAAAGAGFGLALCGDIVIAAESANFMMAYTNVGLSADGSSSYFLPRLIGLRKTQELMFTNRRLSAQDAMAWGMVNQVVPDAALLTTAEALAATFVAGPLDSYATMKKLLLVTFDNGLETQMELESRGISGCAATRNGREGIRAFSEKRRPQFE